jgi:hypothetical protein
MISGAELAEQNIGQIQHDELVTGAVLGAEDSRSFVGGILDVTHLAVSRAIEYVSDGIESAGRTVAENYRTGLAVFVGSVVAAGAPTALAETFKGDIPDAPSPKVANIIEGGLFSTSLAQSPIAHTALIPCAEAVGAVPCAAPPIYEKGCKPASIATAPRVKIQVDNANSRTSSYMTYSDGFFASDANRNMKLKGILTVPYVHYRDVIKVNLLGCNEMATAGNFKEVKIPGNLAAPHQIPHAYQLMTVEEGQRVIFSHKYAVTEP